MVRDKLRRLREARNYTQEHMANQLGMSQNNYSKIESGDIRKIDIDRIMSIAKILEVPIDQLLGEDSQTFHFENSHIEKFYGYVENLQEENKELVGMLKEQVRHLQGENERLLKMVEELSRKK